MNSLQQKLNPRAVGNSIELKLQEVSQLFNSMDPSPFYEKDLDHDAEEFIVSWARELSDQPQLRLVLHLGEPVPSTYSEAGVADAVRNYFCYRASINRLELRRLLKLGRVSLVIGACFLIGCLWVSNVIANHVVPGAFWDIARESLTIGGWVAMWRPMEIYLYDWWPLWRHGNLLGKLGRMEVDLRSKRNPALTAELKFAA